MCYTTTFVVPLQYYVLLHSINSTQCDNILFLTPRELPAAVPLTGGGSRTAVNIVVVVAVLILLSHRYYNAVRGHRTDSNNSGAENDVRRKNKNNTSQYTTISRSPRWTNGSPGMPLVLVREYESRRVEILNIFPTKKKRINS